MEWVGEHQRKGNKEFMPKTHVVIFYNTLENKKFLHAYPETIFSEQESNKNINILLFYIKFVYIKVKHYFLFFSNFILFLIFYSL